MPLPVVSVILHKCVCCVHSLTTNLLILPICDWIYGNHSKLHIGSYEIISFKDFKAKDCEHANETQKLDHFTVFKSFLSTSCCSQKFPPNNLEKIG